MKKIFLVKIIGLSLIIGLGGCTSFLDVKSDDKLAVPASLDDFLALLSHTDNVLGVAEGEVMSADHYVEDDPEIWFCQTNLDLYRWEDTPLIQECDGDIGWRAAYQNIYRANTVLEGVKKFEEENEVSSRSSSIKGHAYFNRAISYFELAQVWAEAYDKEPADVKLGVPLKHTADFNEPTIRPSLQKTFEQIVGDLQKAAELLPERQPFTKWPSKVAAWAYLARVYLYMNEFEQAGLYAGKCIDSDFYLFDFNKVDSSPRFPFSPTENPELIYFRVLTTAYYSIDINISLIDTLLYKSYAEEDLRKNLFFTIRDDGKFLFRGDYGGGMGGSFSGPTIAEMYLIVAESAIRQGNEEKARTNLFTFLKHRMEEGYVFPDIGEDKLLSEILKERRKELLRRGVRFGDVKRLNNLGAGITLKRTVWEKDYTLPPNDPRAAALIPEDVIKLSGIEQNPR